MFNFFATFSFGQTAIFLLGGKTIDEKPIAISLNSGDIVVMSKQSRLCYHGVPKIIRANSEPWNKKSSGCSTHSVDSVFDKEVIANCTQDWHWKLFNDYLNNSRININVRQVLYERQIKL